MHGVEGFRSVNMDASAKTFAAAEYMKIACQAVDDALTSLRACNKSQVQCSKHSPVSGAFFEAIIFQIPKIGFEDLKYVRVIWCFLTQKWCLCRIRAMRNTNRRPGVYTVTACAHVAIASLPSSSV